MGGRDTSCERKPPRVPDEPAADQDVPGVPVDLVTGILACLVFGSLGITVALVVASRPGGPHVLAALAIALLLLVLQAIHCASKYRKYAGKPLSRIRWLTFLTQGVLTYVPFAAFGEAWLGIPGLLAGATLLLWSAPLAWVGYGAVVVAQAGLGWWLGLDLARLAEAVAVTAVTGFVFYGVARLLGVAYDLQVSRRELARIAVREEQERFRRDLHDLLGHRLMAVAFKSELAKRLLNEHDRNKADEQLTEVIEAVRQAQSDVRAVAYGYPSGSLEHELSQVRSTLEAAGVRPRIEPAEGLAVDQLPPILDAVLAAVLHEGVTNVLRHSFAQLCEIEIAREGDELRLTVVNDGVRYEPHRQAAGGAGIPGLTDRVAAVGGELSAGPRNGEQFRLVARIPLAGRMPEAGPGGPVGDRR
jgi:two-component system, NarL family, sensor histidine kinase DesK